MTKQILTQEQLKQQLHYDQDTGIFRWACIKRGVSLGKLAGFNGNSKKYSVIGINKKEYYSHRLAWLYMTGSWPKEQIDHINGIKNDNRWINLRIANNLENNRNKGISKSNTSGHKGVHWCANVKKWRATVGHNGKVLHLGVFSDIDLAVQAYQNFCKENYGAFYSNLS